MSGRSDAKWIAPAVAIVVLVLSLLTVILLDSLTDLPTAATTLTIVLIIVPVIVYLAISGAIESATSPFGGIRFRTLIQLPGGAVNPLFTPRTLTTLAYEQFPRCEEYSDLDDYVKQVQRWTPDTLAIVLDSPQGTDEDREELRQICTTVEFLNRYRLWSNIEYVLVVDLDERLLAFLSARAIRPAPDPSNADTCIVGRLVDWLERAQDEKLGHQDEVRLQQLEGFVGPDHFLDADFTFREALETMRELAVDALPVVSREQRLTGILERSRLAVSMFTQMAAAERRGV